MFSSLKDKTAFSTPSKASKYMQINNYVLNKNQTAKLDAPSGCVTRREEKKKKQRELYS